MKKLFTLAFIIALTISVFAQSPQKMSYQAVIRNASGVLVTNHAVGMKVSILQGSASGSAVYSETYSPVPMTNANGLVTVEIGSGTPVSGTFTAINWAAGPYFLKAETDPDGGISYSITGTSQILSVPYALNSKIAEGVADNSITSAKIVDGSVATADLANNSLTSAKIIDGTIVAADIADNAITNSKIILAAVSTDKLGNSAVTSPKLASMGATTGQVLTYNGTSWTPQSIPVETSTWQLSESDIYFNTGKVGIGKIPGSDLRQFQVLTTNNQAIAAVNNSTGYAAIFALNQGTGPAAEFRNFIRIADGTEGDAKILTSNATGFTSWKTLSVVSDATLTGSGTTASPLKIAQMGATAGQVIKWNGTSWASATDNPGPWMESDLYIYNSSDKKFGIGTYSPSRKVTIAESGTEAYLNIQNSSTGYTISDGILLGMQGVNGWLTTYENGSLNIGTNNTMKMIIESGGDVGIGTTNPGYKLQVGLAGDGTQARANAWNLLSDVNLKRDLSRLTNPLAMVEKLTGYYFFWNTGIDQTRQVGFSAQEVKEVLPEVVSEGEDGYFSIEYGKMVPLLLEAIKEQQKQIDELKHLVKNLMQK